MGLIYLHDKIRIENFLRENVFLHLYSIGDLDDFFFSDTVWYGWKQGSEIQAVALLYTASDEPTLLALSERQEIMCELIRSIFHVLPDQFYAHLSPRVAEAVRKHCKIESCAKHYKMGLKNTTHLRDIDCSQVVHLTENDLEEMLGLYKEGYPGNWFDARMLQTKQYFGLRLNNRLLSIAGIHVYSEKYKVAALGNIVTHPEYRGRGFGTVVTAGLCRSLAGRVDNIGLNVKTDNIPAITLYEKLGFEIVGTYYELMVLDHPAK